jgi:hypothetical protein
MCSACSTLLIHGINLIVPHFIRMFERLTQKVCVFAVQIAPDKTNHLRDFASTSRRMIHPTAQRKHDILIHCQSRRASESEVDVAAAHGVIASRKTIFNWRRQWTGTPQSLMRKDGSGRASILTPSEVNRHVRAPILAANRSHRAASYTKIYDLVKQKTRKNLSLRTLQRIGKEQLHIKSKAAVKRTKEEGQYRATSNESDACIFTEHCADIFVQSLLLPVRRLPIFDSNYRIATHHTSSSSMRLLYASPKLRHTHSYYRVNNHSSLRPRLLHTAKDTI